MTDKELLEFAAKAAGMEADMRYAGCWYNDNGIAWGPLTDDGDALRLAVKLKLLVDSSSCVAAHTTFEAPWFGGGDDPEAGQSHDECDPYAATRRAIVRAAAEIGKAMK